MHWYFFFFCYLIIYLLRTYGYLFKSTILYISFYILYDVDVRRTRKLDPAPQGYYDRANSDTIPE
jgi:hypothetical protein